MAQNRVLHRRKSAWSPKFPNFCAAANVRFRETKMPCSRVPAQRLFWGDRQPSSPISSFSDME